MQHNLINLRYRYINLKHFNKMKHLKALSVLFLLIFVFASCKKDDATTPTTASKTDLISKTWQVQKLSGKASGFDLTLYEKGKTDNAMDMSKFRLAFAKDGKCVMTDPDGIPATTSWKFTENETKIVIGTGTDQVTFTLTKLETGNFDFFLKETDQGTETIVNYYMIPA